MLFARAAAVRSPSELAIMRRAGRVVAEMHHDIRQAIYGADYLGPPGN